METKDSKFFEANYSLFVPRRNSMMELKQKNKLTNVSVRSFVESILRNAENSVFTCIKNLVDKHWVA